MTPPEPGRRTGPALLIATGNPHKLQEIRAILSSTPVDLVSLDTFAPVPEPEETGATFEENARLKALYYAAAANMMAVADDSGLEIDALDGEPGVRSARFVRPDATYPELFDEIFRRLDAAPGRPRTARFVCAVAVACDGAVIFETRATVEGLIADAPHGDAGFGYDPIFCYPPYGRTLAEVTRSEKLQVAHRGIAFRALAEWLRARTS